MGIQNRRKYNSDFKKNAVLLAKEPRRSVSEVADNFGENRDLAFPGNGIEALADEQKRIRELEKELKSTANSPYY